MPFWSPYPEEKIPGRIQRLPEELRSRATSMLAAHPSGEAWRREPDLTIDERVEACLLLAAGCSYRVVERICGMAPNGGSDVKRCEKKVLRMDVERLEQAIHALPGQIRERCSGWVQGHKAGCRPSSRSSNLGRCKPDKVHLSETIGAPGKPFWGPYPEETTLVYIRRLPEPLRTRASSRLAAHPNGKPWVREPDLTNNDRIDICLLLASGCSLRAVERTYGLTPHGGMAVKRCEEKVLKRDIKQLERAIADLPMEIRERCSGWLRVQGAKLGVLPQLGAQGVHFRDAAEMGAFIASLMRAGFGYEVSDSEDGWFVTPMK